MKTAVASYSMTGNNEALAGSVAKELVAEHISVTEARKRTMGTIVADLLFGRIPHIQQATESLKNFDRVLLLGPIWIGSVATPLRPFLKQLKKTRKSYAFASISGGADGHNLKLAAELKKRTGAEPFALLDLLIADLLPPEPKPTRDDTSKYKINGSDIKKLTGMIVEAVKKN